MLIQLNQNGPKDHKLVRQHMVDTRHLCQYINDNVNSIRRMLEWAVENDMIPVATSLGTERPKHLPG